MVPGIRVVVRFTVIAIALLLRGGLSCFCLSLEEEDE